MALLRINRGFARLDAFEVELCRPFNRLARIQPVRWYFRVASRLGDGVAWYALLVVLPLVFGIPAILPTLLIGIAALVGVFLHKGLKVYLVRERPFLSQRGILAVTKPLDRYSFPSGHAMHAACFMTLLFYLFPTVAWLMLPLAISIGISRVVMGLHYPTDVLAGGLLGWGIARLSLLVGGLIGIGP